MKDVEHCNINKMKDSFHKDWGLYDFIKSDALLAMEKKKYDQLAKYSNLQLSRFLAYGGYSCTQAAESAVRTVLFSRIEVGDSVIALPFDLIHNYMEITDDMLVWRTVDKRNARQIRLENAGWFSKNNICWTEMARQKEQEA